MLSSPVRKVEQSRESMRLKRAAIQAVETELSSLKAFALKMVDHYF